MPGIRRISGRAAGWPTSRWTPHIHCLRPRLRIAPLRRCRLWAANRQRQHSPPHRLSRCRAVELAQLTTWQASSATRPTTRHTTRPPIFAGLSQKRPPHPFHWLDGALDAAPIPESARLVEPTCAVNPAFSCSLTKTTLEHAQEPPNSTPAARPGTLTG